MNDSIIKDLVIRKDRPLVSSLVVAERFGKEHKNVLQSIESLEISDDFKRLNFQPIGYTDGRNRMQKAYNMTRDGFMLLVMGFTGGKAMDIKIGFINAFNHMEGIIKKQLENAASEAWKQVRSQGKTIREMQTDVIKDFVEYATKQGSENAHYYYSTLTKTEYKALNLIEVLDNPPEQRRNVLNVVQLMDLGAAENLVSRTLKRGMDAKLHYKDIFKLCKSELERLADVLGTTNIGETPTQSLGYSGMQIESK